MPSPALAPLLEVDGLTAGYAGRPVVFDVRLRVRAGETVVLLGSNGAGKTTTLRSILGLIAPHEGAVRFDGAAWSTATPWKAAAAGIAFIPAERFTFADLTVAENLALGASTAPPAERQERLDSVCEMFPILAQRRSQQAGTMSGGEQRMLSLGVALMSGPRLLLLDEPSLGLAPSIVERIFAVIGDLVAGGMSVLMVEQNVGQALRIADNAYVMRSGRIILEQPADELRARDEWWDLF